MDGKYYSYWNDEQSFHSNSPVGNGCYVIFKVAMVRNYHHSPYEKCYCHVANITSNF